MVRVLICDDQVVVCEGLRAILSASDEIEVAGVAYDGEQAVAMAIALQPDIVLMDLKMPGMNGIRATREIRQKFSDIKVLVLTTYDFDEWVLEAIRSGASGYLLKDSPREALILAILGTAQGKSFIDPLVAGKVLDQVRRNPGLAAPDAEIVHKLSEREQAVLRLLGLGLTNTEIAERLYLAEGTVKNYISAILSKLNLTDRTQAAVLAIQAGLVESTS
jgi:two-component system, NarL family, response regulator LiaR